MCISWVLNKKWVKNLQFLNVSDTFARESVSPRGLAGSNT